MDSWGGALFAREISSEFTVASKRYKAWYNQDMNSVDYIYIPGSTTTLASSAESNTFAGQRGYISRR